MAQTFEMLSDAELELATGGVSVSVSIDKGGIAIAGPLGEVRVPNPLSLLGHVVNGALNVVGGVLEGAGGALRALGRVFHGGH